MCSQLSQLRWSWIISIAVCSLSALTPRVLCILLSRIFIIPNIPVVTGFYLGSQYILFGLQLPLSHATSFLFLRENPSGKTYIQFVKSSPIFRLIMDGISVQYPFDVQCLHFLMISLDALVCWCGGSTIPPIKFTHTWHHRKMMQTKSSVIPSHS